MKGWRQQIGRLVLLGVLLGATPAAAMVHVVRWAPITRTVYGTPAEVQRYIVWRAVNGGYFEVVYCGEIDVHDVYLLNLACTDREVPPGQVCYQVTAHSWTGGASLPFAKTCLTCRGSGRQGSCTPVGH